MSTEVETPVVAPAVTEDKKEIIEEEAAKAAEEAKAAAEKKDEEKKPEEADKKARLTSTQIYLFLGPYFFITHILQKTQVTSNYNVHSIPNHFLV